MNWTIIIMTALICATALALADYMEEIARIRWECLKTKWDIQAMVRGYQPEASVRETRHRSWEGRDEEQWQRKC